MEFFNLRLQAKFKDFVDKEGWRNLSPRHGTDNDHDVDCDTAADNAGGEVPGMAGGGGGVGGGDGTGGVGGSDSEEPLAVNVDGRMVRGGQGYGYDGVWLECDGVRSWRLTRIDGRSIFFSRV